MRNALMIIDAPVNDLFLFSFRLEELLSGLLALHTHFTWLIDASHDRCHMHFSLEHPPL